MANISFIAPDGRTVGIDVPDGWTLMQAARSEGVEGIEAECGGSCACATCYVYIEGAAAANVPPPGENELLMLDSVAAELRPNSRLCCQITAAPALEGLVVRVAETQG
jgi:2Fe-2S ferredoxin